MDMDKVKKYAPYVFVGSLVAWLWIYSCLSLHYSSNIATYHQKLSTDLRKIRKQYMSKFYESEEELRVAGLGHHARAEGADDGIDEVDNDLSTINLLSKMLKNDTIN